MATLQLRRVVVILLCTAVLAVMVWLIAGLRVKSAYYKHVLRSSYDIGAAMRLTDLPGGDEWLVKTFESSPDARLRSAIVWCWQGGDLPSFYNACGATRDPDAKVRQDALQVVEARVLRVSAMIESVAESLVAADDPAMKLRLAWALSAATGGGFQVPENPSAPALDTAARAWLKTRGLMEEKWLAHLRQVPASSATSLSR